MIVELFVILLSLYVAWGIGANDVNFAGPVASRIIKIRYAILLAAVAALIGALFFGSNVSNTLREGIIFETFSIAEVFAIMLSIAVWSTFASYMGWPISGTASIISAILGIVLISQKTLNIPVLSNIFLSWIISPLVAFIFAFIFYKIFARTVFISFKGFGARESLEIFMSYVQMIIVFVVVVFRSANDVAQAIFFFENSNPIFFRFLGGIGIGIGILTLGRKVIRSLGTRLTEMNPSGGVAVQFSSMIVIAFFTLVGMPISGSIVFVSALAGTGMARNKPVNASFAKEILFSWVITIPVSAILSVLLYSLITNVLVI